MQPNKINHGEPEKLCSLDFNLKELKNRFTKSGLSLPIPNACAKLPTMKPGWIFKDKQVIQLPSLTAVIEKDGRRFVSICPELGVASQGKTRKETYAMLAEAVELWLGAVGAASAKEIIRRLKMGASVQPLELAYETSARLSAV